MSLKPERNSTLIIFAWDKLWCREYNKLFSECFIGASSFGKNFVTFVQLIYHSEAKMHLLAFLFHLYINVSCFLYLTRYPVQQNKNQNQNNCMIKQESLKKKLNERKQQKQKKIRNQKHINTTIKQLNQQIQNTHTHFQSKHR